MLVNFLGQITNPNSCKHYAFMGFEFYVNGFVFMAGKQAGYETIEQLAYQMNDHDTIPFESLHGAFSIFIVYPGGQITAFTDNSKLHALYIHDHAISDSFLELTDYLVQQEHACITFSKDALAELYSVGRVFFGKTMIEGITLSDSFFSYSVKNDCIRHEEKNILDIDSGADDFSPDCYFSDLSLALTGVSTSVALTGGYDSRMVYSFLKNRMPITPSLSGDCITATDIIIAQRVANRAGDRLNLVRTTKPSLSETLLRHVFETQDGECSLASPSEYRLLEFFEALSSENIDIHITGDGGVLHKDWEWMQDLPFYRKKHTDLARFYHQRLAYNFSSQYAGCALKDSLGNMKERTLTCIAQYRRKYNTQSYDMLYFHVNGRRDTLYNATPCGVMQYAPLLEKSFVAYSYSLPRRKRFFYNNMRKLTTEQNADIADIPTCYGTTASSKPVCIIRDCFIQPIDYMRKAIRMLGRKFFGKSLLTGNVLTWTIRKELNALAITQKAVQFCIQQGYIEHGVAVCSLSDVQLSFALRVFLLNDHLNNDIQISHAKQKQQDGRQVFSCF